MVDDNEINRRVASRILENLGYAADIARDGLEALRRLAERKCDLVLMDIQMPRMDGLAATRAIRSGQVKDVDPALPIIAVTANALPESEAECLEAGMNAFTTKPVRPERLAELLARELRTVARRTSQEMSQVG